MGHTHEYDKLGAIFLLWSCQPILEVSIKLKNVPLSQYCVKKDIFNRINEVVSNNTVQMKTNNTEERKELHKLFTKTDKNEDDKRRDVLNI